MYNIICVTAACKAPSHAPSTASYCESKVNRSIFGTNDSTIKNFLKSNPNIIKSEGLPVQNKEDSMGNLTLFWPPFHAKVMTQIMICGLELCDYKNKCVL